MFIDYCNGSDVGALLKLRKTITQLEVKAILRQVVKACRDIWAINIIHRDIKLANVLLHFPNRPDLDTMDKKDKLNFLRTVNLAEVEFIARLADFGLSTIHNPDRKGHQSICGTPLYSAPQLLRKNRYTYKVDVWALGIMTYEMLMGRTPFHSYEMRDLIAKINKGDYSVILRQPITVECALFLTQCLQANEPDRLDVQMLLDHPFLTGSCKADSLTDLDSKAY